LFYTNKGIIGTGIAFNFYVRSICLLTFSFSVWLLNFLYEKKHLTVEGWTTALICCKDWTDLKKKSFQTKNEIYFLKVVNIIF
jgi:hypothetical protein